MKKIDPKTIFTKGRVTILLWTKVGGRSKKTVESKAIIFQNIA